jgi:carbon monoxide dehydrogenase subunit G
VLNTSHEIEVLAAVDDAWKFVKNMSNWASQMPGYKKFEVVSEDDSVWTVQVNIGPFSQTTVADVHVTKWHEPTEVTFEFIGRSDPYRGSGAYTSRPKDGNTLIQLDLSVEVSGPMAGMLNVMAGPILKKMGRQFAANLKTRIEAYPKTILVSIHAPVSRKPRRSRWSVIIRTWLSRILHRP